ncbi:snakin-2 isoform X2 [Magnolia sinica]|uniref:snakin-2 isoform X2 n=1 Tax=Magnolia sinica TaxID=86752 RepID=UPI00265B52CC|nr:snakin-2 isoform X2 [Magnolia sinica]
MAFSRAIVAFLLLTLFSLSLVQARHGFESHSLMASGAERNLLQRIDCGTACGVRCSLSSRPRLCKRACGTCCGRCNCVPPGTSGNHEKCPCYANLTTRGNKRKCP